MKKIVLISAGTWVKLLAIFVLLSTIWCWGSTLLRESKESIAVWKADSLWAETVQSKKNWWVSLNADELKDFLSLPIVALKENQASDSWWSWIIGFDPTNPYQQIKRGLDVLALAEKDKQLDKMPTIIEEDIYSARAALAEDWHFETARLEEIPLTEEVQIILYHTHNAETYTPTDGVSKRAGENAGVSTAADVLGQALERKYGLRTLHSKVLHDYPDWNRSYINSLATIQSLLKSYPDVRAVFDVHRDAGFTSKEPTTVMLGGSPAAKIMIVVGANHDNWKQNLAFAQALEDKSNLLYPGLVRSIRIVQANRYNQQAHNHSLILEVGSDLNTQEEANYAMECFAQVVAEVLAEEAA